MTRLYQRIHKAADLFYRSCFYTGALFATAMTLIVIINIVSLVYLDRLFACWIRFALAWDDSIAIN